VLIDINTRSGVPIYRQIFEQVRRQILTGRAEPGSQLPSVRDLGAELKVNPMTVSKAYAMLERDGLVEKRRGIGLFVAERGQRDQDRSRLSLLEATLKDAAISAVQLGVPKKQAADLFAKLYTQFNSRAGDQR
jgi:GntR family transcriptional regulator